MYGMTLFCSILHFLVDGVCAAAMIRHFTGGAGGYFNILVYNFCAFVLQMPFGALMDSISEGRLQLRRMEQGLQRWPLCFVAAGVVLTIIGAFTSPVVLGIGNALFHVGGGVGTIREDRACGSAGRRLGVFVAPGAMGLYLGRLAAQSPSAWTAWMTGCALAMVALSVALWIVTGKEEVASTEVKAKEAAEKTVEGASSYPGKATEVATPKYFDFLIVSGCFAVVVLRSYVGMSVAMPWKTTVSAGLLVTAMVVLGKMAGGFSAASLGRRRTVIVSLLLAAAGYAFCDRMPAGLAALFLFNMTMPVTLQILVDWFPELPGTMFGLLTVGLFVGFLPVYYSLSLPASGKVIGAVGSLVSMLILLLVIEVVDSDSHRGRFSV